MGLPSRALTISRAAIRRRPSTRFTRGLRDGEQHQVLLGVTGSGKTFTMAKVIEQMAVPRWFWRTTRRSRRSSITNSKPFSRPTRSNISSAITITTSPKPTFPSSDVYIEKEATINDELDKLRLSATRSLFERRDCVIVASVSCIYGLGSPEAYYGMLLMLEKGQKIAREEITSRLVDILYERNDGDFKRGTFRVRGDVIELFPTYDDYAYRIELWGDEIESLAQIDPLLGQVNQTYLRLPIYPKTHYVMSRRDARQRAMRSIENELTGGKAELDKQGKLIEAQRLWQRTMFDLEMMQRDRLLPRHRELFAAFFRTPAGRSSAHAARLSAARFAHVHRRKPPDHPAASRHVSRRPLAQRGAGQVRFPPAQRARQPPADLRGIREPRQSGGLRLGDAGAV